jgi:hypothetical protein
VIYLGPNVPAESLYPAIRELVPDHLLYFLVHHDLPEDTQTYLDRLAEHCPQTLIHLAGNESLIRQLRLPPRAQWIRSVDEFMKEIEN